jgi:hypothetical protein
MNKKMKTAKSTSTSASNTATATKVKSLVTQAKTLLAVGEPLTTKARKEVLVRSIRTNSAMVQAAASAYTENTDVLGGDLDPSAALGAQDFVTQMTPVATELAALTQALEDRLSEEKASSAGFTQTVYDRLKGLQSMPQGAALAPRLAQIEKLRPKRKPKAVVADAGTVAPATAPATASKTPEPVTPAPATPSVVVNASN